MINTTWNIIKSLSTQKSVPLQYFIDNNTYTVLLVDGQMIMSCCIFIESPANSEQLDFETNFKPYANKSISQIDTLPFASKTIGNKKLYRRKHGVSANCLTVISGTPFTDIPLTVPYSQCKIDKIEIVGCEAGDKVNFKVYDSTAGIVQQMLGVPAASIVPNKLLNQFGFDVCVPSGFYEDHSQYDADLYVGMLIEVEYINNGTVSKTIGVNFTLHEMK